LTNASTQVAVSFPGKYEPEDVNKKSLFPLLDGRKLKCEREARKVLPGWLQSMSKEEEAASALAESVDTMLKILEQLDLCLCVDKDRQLFLFPALLDAMGGDGFGECRKCAKGWRGRRLLLRDGLESFPPALMSFFTVRVYKKLAPSEETEFAESERWKKAELSLVDVLKYAWSDGIYLQSVTNCDTYVCVSYHKGSDVECVDILCSGSKACEWMQVLMAELISTLNAHCPSVVGEMERHVICPVCLEIEMPRAMGSIRLSAESADRDIAKDDFVEGYGLDREGVGRSRWSCSAVDHSRLELLSHLTAPPSSSSSSGFLFV
jgi:hypothetical protein